MLAAALLACALNVAPATMDAIINVESGRNPYALHVNKLSGLQPHPTTAAEAVTIAKHYIAAGYSVDIGLSQTNSRHLSELHLTVGQLLDPCINIAGGAAILSAFYTKAVQQFGEGQRALMGALSGYNSGSLTAGFYSGYVGKYYITANLPTAPVRPVLVRTFPTTVAYDRPGLDLRLNKD